MATCFAKMVGVRKETLIHIHRGALLHDMGKLGVPDSILLKPGPLNEEEWVVMRKHPKIAYEMLSPIDYLKPALEIPYYHHEKWDGTGLSGGVKRRRDPSGGADFCFC
jgi:response regulator RpfG family c-di-GMP phosphodiesterase